MQVQVSEISILCLYYTANLFFGPTAGSQRSANAVSCYMHLKVDPQKVNHLVLI
jgi:hypothetical protein